MELDYEKLKQLKEYAESHRLSLEDLSAIREGRQLISEEHYVLINNYKIMFTIGETLNHKWIRRMSMSIINSDERTNIKLKREVCTHLGFEDLDRCKMQEKGLHKNGIETLECIDKTELKLVPYMQNIWLETDHNLLIKTHEWKPLCIGYLNKEKIASPLTPDKIEVCQKLGICYVNI